MLLAVLIECSAAFCQPMALERPHHWEQPRGMVRCSSAEIEQRLLDLLPGRSSDADGCISQLIEMGGVEQPALSPLIEGDWVLLQTSSSDFDLRNPLGRRLDGSAPGLEGAIAALSECLLAWRPDLCSIV